ncbi:hypothetical protein XENOCAPTIV_003605 [Xenoophorus captivus]|uniref:Uncharacterized protein n=1 Tax=Xenoophorus captivus TaxID=1517983 RepID=A0ABV0Q7V0_9TELE
MLTHSSETEIPISLPGLASCYLATAWQTVESQKTVPPSGTHQGGRNLAAPMAQIPTLRQPTGPASLAGPT